MYKLKVIGLIKIGKRTHNHLVKMKLYKEIGIPPVLKNSEKCSSTKVDQKQLNTVENNDSHKVLPQNQDNSENRRTALWKRRRPKTPASQARNASLKPKLLTAEKRESMHEIKEDKAKLMPSFNIYSIKQFMTQNCGSIHDYDFNKKIGKGAYAIVKLAKHIPTNTQRAVKLYDRSKLIDSTRKQSLVKEIKILKRIDHPNIIKFYEAIDTSKYVYL